MARAQGLEPQPAVLETVMLPLHHASVSIITPKPTAPHNFCRFIY